MAGRDVFASREATSGGLGANSVVLELLAEISSREGPFAARAHDILGLAAHLRRIYTDVVALGVETIESFEALAAAAVSVDLDTQLLKALYEQRGAAQSSPGSLVSQVLPRPSPRAFLTPVPKQSLRPPVPAGGALARIASVRGREQRDNHLLARIADLRKRMQVEVRGLRELARPAQGDEDVADPEAGDVADPEAGSSPQSAGGPIPRWCRRGKRGRRLTPKSKRHKAIYIYIDQSIYLSN